MGNHHKLLAAGAAAAAGGGTAVLAAARKLYQVGFATGAAERGKPALPEQGSCYSPFRAVMKADFDALCTAPAEQVSILNRQGLRLAGRYYHTADGAPLVLFFHGWRGRAERDGCGGFRLCRDYGCNLLLVDQRGHGASEGACLTMGVKERDDCADWANWAAARWPGTPLFVMGVSMGAATVLMSADRGLPAAVAGLVADCGYTSPRDILRKCLPETVPGLPLEVCYRLGRLGARAYGGFDPEAADARKALAHCKVPVLFFHGADDDFVPCFMSRQNYAACASPRRLVVVPGAPHGVSCYVDPERYRRELYDFMNRCLGRE